VFHVRALYYTKTLITNKCTKRVLSSIVTHSYMFRPCWVIFRENNCYRYTKVALYSWVRMCCWLCTVHWRRELSAVRACSTVLYYIAAASVHCLRTQFDSSVSHQNSVTACGVCQLTTETRRKWQRIIRGTCQAEVTRLFHGRWLFAVKISVPYCLSKKVVNFAINGQGTPNKQTAPVASFMVLALWHVQFQ
jgi:hypothetical protein